MTSAASSAAGSFVVESAAASTSSRVTRPSLPDPFTASISTPRSRASLRTGGVASARAGCSGWSGASSSRRPILRFLRRFDPPSSGPYPTRTSLRPVFGASSVVSTVMIVEPTATFAPTSPKIFSTVPAKGDGISTSAFSVSTSTIGWFSSIVSPSFTSHCTISASVSPSPRSGSLKSRALISSSIQHRRRPAHGPGRASTDPRPSPGDRGCRSRRLGSPERAGTGSRPRRCARQAQPRTSP